MKKISILAAVMAAAITVSMTGCGSGTAPAQSEPEEKAPEAVTVEEVSEPVEENTETDTQNPVMNYVGAYSDEGGQKYSLFIEATDGVDGVMINIGRLSDDENDYWAWTMSGKIKDNVITYSDAVQIYESYDPESENGVTHEEVYTDGTGTFEITEDKKITWKDDKENAGEGLVFVWNQELNDKVQQMMQENQDEDTSSDGFTAMDWAGPYKANNDENLTMEITAGEDGLTCSFSIMKKGEGSEAVNWTMSGPYKDSEASVEYDSCQKRNVRIDEMGEIESGDTIYDDGTGTFIFDKEKMTIFEALAMAGDLGEFNSRKEIKLVREKNGVTTIKTFDARSKDLVNSEYYYIEPNDIIYIRKIPGYSFGINSAATVVGVTAATLSFGVFVYSIVQTGINHVKKYYGSGSSKAMPAKGGAQ